jgi:hypothetical protein
MGKLTKGKLKPELQRQIDRSFNWSRAAFTAVLRGYTPPDICYDIVGAMVAGLNSHKDVADQLGITQEDYVTVMSDPRNACWVSQALLNSLQHLVGQAHLKMLQMAMDGNVGAYKALTANIATGDPKKNINLNISGTPDQFRSWSNEQVDEELERKIEEYSRARGTVFVKPRRDVEGGEGGNPPPTQPQSAETP